MGELTIVAIVYTPFVIFFGVLSYYWNYLVNLKRSKNDIQCFASL